MPSPAERAIDDRLVRAGGEPMKDFIRENGDMNGHRMVQVETVVSDGNGDGRTAIIGI